jgi:hypothetical protein
MRGKPSVSSRESGDLASFSKSYPRTKKARSGYVRAEDRRGEVARTLEKLCTGGESKTKALISAVGYGPTKQLAEKGRTEQESNTSGAKARRILNRLRPD